MQGFKLIMSMGALLLLASGCSVSQAAKKTGVEVDKVVNCGDVICFQALPTAELVERVALNEEQSRYRFRFQLRQGSTLRALGYGGAAVFTLGLSEVVASPLEGAVQNDKQFIADAICINKNETCSGLVIYQPGKEPMLVRGNSEDFGLQAEAVSNDSVESTS